MSKDYILLIRATSGLPVALHVYDISSYSGNHDNSTYVTLKNREGFCVREPFHAVAAAIDAALS